VSVTIEPQLVRLRDPTHDAQRRLREQPEQRLAAADDIRALREKKPETVRRTISPTTSPLASLDSQLENAVYESLRRPLDSREIRALAPGMGRCGALSGVAGRLLTVVGVSTITWQCFFIMMPPVRQPDSAQLFAAAVQAFTTAQAKQHQSEDAPKPTLAEFRSLLASGNTAQAMEREQSEKESDEILQQFLQWRHKANLSEAAQ
jgi:hypothetical protein